MISSRVKNDFKKKIYPIENSNYIKFFSNLPPFYKWIPTTCPCNIKKNDEEICNVDRHGVFFITVLCANCGLIRAKNYLDKKSLNDFYLNHYRKIMKTNHLTTDELFAVQEKDWVPRYKIIKRFIKQDEINKNFIITDVGGGIGGALSKLVNIADCYLYDYYDSYLEFAKKKNIKVVKGGLLELKQSSQKSNLIILSHVVEHWSSFNEEIENLISCCDQNTLVYLEFPGVDSIKYGRRHGDFLKDIHVPHFFYFTQRVINNLMNRNGFDTLYSNSYIRALYRYTGKKRNFKNYYKQTKLDLIIAENIVKFFFDIYKKLTNLLIYNK